MDINQIQMDSHTTSEAARHLDNEFKTNIILYYYLNNPSRLAKFCHMTFTLSTVDI